ncbi:MAG: NAD(P)H-dependent glycerol-3-phosphate dehydrogenase [Clostridia bacterium]|nr:NAD(P)H-dependent glycerol-3-phosphate dehydrogenase [Clostridia bacterium]
MMKIAVIGSGSFGTAVSSLLGKKGYDVALWSFLKDEAERIEKDRENKEFLKGVKLLDTVHCSNDMKECVEGADLIVTVVPSFATRQTAKALAEVVKSSQPLVNLSKGLENDTLLRMSQVYQEELVNNHIAVMSGPSHAEEVGMGLPTTNVVACENDEVAALVQDIFMDESFRVYLSSDKIGVEIGGALKNVIALCAGICDGLGYGDNTKAALMTRGISEIKRLGVAMGAEAETFAGLSGIGDLIVTCTSMHSRNRRAGILLGQGKTMEETLDEVHMVVEGIHTAKAAFALSQKYGVDMPIVEQACKILFENKSPKLAVKELMTREKRFEN